MKLRRIIAFVMAIAMTLQVGIYENTTRVDAATSGEAISVFYDTYTDKAMYDPGDTVKITVNVNNKSESKIKSSGIAGYAFK